MGVFPISSCRRTRRLRRRTCSWSHGYGHESSSANLLGSESNRAAAKCRGGARICKASARAVTSTLRRDRAGHSPDIAASALRCTPERSSLEWPGERLTGGSCDRFSHPRTCGSHQRGERPTPATQTLSLGRSSRKRKRRCPGAAGAELRRASVVPRCRRSACHPCARDARALPFRCSTCFNRDSVGHSCSGRGSLRSSVAHGKTWGA